MKRGYKEIASKILDCTLASYYNWSKQKRPIINLLEKYFTKEELSEFLTSGEIQKQESIKDFSIKDIQKALKLDDTYDTKEIIQKIKELCSLLEDKEINLKGEVK